MTAAVSDLDLYLRGAETLVASWQEYARGARCASVRRFPGVAAAVFPNEPERSLYNNGLLARGLSAAARTDALAPLILDNLWPLWDTKHQAWHDKVAASVVVSA